MKPTWIRLPLLLSVWLFAIFTFSDEAGSPGSSARPALIPQPREYRAAHDVAIGAGVAVVSQSSSKDDKFAADDLKATLKERGVKVAAVATGARIELLRTKSAVARRLLREEKIAFDAPMRDEGYAVITRGKTAYVIGESAAGVFYGAQTVKQLVQGNGKNAVLRGAAIRDWPAMKYRGLHDDLSRGPVPTLEFQKKQIRTLASLKVNVYSPYFENTMQYKQNPLAALPGGSMSVEDVAELVAYAAKYHIDVIPEQEAFGHLHNVLVWDKYARLAETPHGAVLAPGQPGSLELIKEWFTELDQMFPGKFLHIGADETFELGRGQTKPDVKQRGLGAVYIEFLNKIHATLTPLNRRLLFWGDVAMNDPELVKTMPKDMIAVAWQYNPQENGFEKWLRPFLDAKMETWVAPGVNNWNRVYPNNDWALRNIQRFTADGQALGSTGALNTVWNDDGEGLFNLDWYGVVFGAAAAWQPGTSDIGQFQRDYAPVFHGDGSGALGQAQQELMEVHKVIARVKLQDATNSLFWADPWSAEGQEVAQKIRPVLGEIRQHTEKALTLIANARQNKNLRERDAVAGLELGARRMDFIALKFLLADEIAAAYNNAYGAQKDPELSKETGRVLAEISGVNGRCQDLRSGYGYLGDMYKDVWLSENRPFWLNNVLAKYDIAQQMWIMRGERFSKARRQWGQTKTLPAPEEVGLPKMVQ
jgi:hexosaminidase